MTDIALVYRQSTASADFAMSAGSLLTDDGLETAMIVSLFTDRRARADDPLPYAGADRRGWWGDVANDDDADEIGSRLWLLEREKMTVAVATRARDYVVEALSWMITDQVVHSVDVETAIVPISAQHPLGALAIGVTLTRPDGPARERYDFIWSATERNLAA